ncbi:MFS transporter [bacterium]|nr:MFS transporter [bacterium]
MNKKILLVLCLAIFTAVLGQGLVVPLLPVYANAMGASGFHIGLIFGIFSISRTFFLPYFGKLSDKKGRKPFLVWGLLFYFLASIAFLASHSVTALVLIRFFQGIASAMIVPVAQAYAAEISPAGSEGRIMALVNISLYFGLSAGPVFGGIIKDLFGIHASFVAMGIACMIGFLMALVFLPPVRAESKNVKKITPHSYRSLIHDRNVIGVLIIRYGYMLCVGSLWSFLPLIADTRYGMSSSTIGILMSLIVFTSAVLSYPIGMLADRTSKRGLVFLGGGITLLGVLLLIYSKSPHDLYLVVGLFGLGGGFLTTSSAAMSAVIGKKLASTGSVMSLLMMGHSAGMFTGPLLSGIIMDYTGNINMSFQIGGTVALILIVTAFFLTRDYHLVEKSV